MHEQFRRKVGDDFVITCDPAAESMLAAATREMAPTLPAWCELAVRCNGELLGGGPGIEPLYRCETDNTGSMALSTGLGFTSATELIAFRFP